MYCYTFTANGGSTFCPRSESYPTINAAKKVLLERLRGEHFRVSGNVSVGYVHDLGVTSSYRELTVELRGNSLRPKYYKGDHGEY